MIYVDNYTPKYRAKVHTCAMVGRRKEVKKMITTAEILERLDQIEGGLEQLEQAVHVLIDIISEMRAEAEKRGR